MILSIVLFLIKASLIIIGVWLFVRLILGRDTKFRRKRIIINSGIAIAFLLPMLTAGTSVHSTATPSETTDPTITIPAISIPIYMTSRDEPQISATSPDFVTIGLVCYATIAGLLIMRLFIRILSVAVLSHRCLKESSGSTTIFRIADSDSGPFSFFSRVYAGERTVLSPEMLRHEEAHITQWHSADIVVSELLTAILWLNPIAWLLRREIRDNLEFLADEASIESSDRISYQYSLLNSCLSSPEATLCTNFNVSSIKKRIRMINRISTTSHGRWIYLIAAPLLIIAVAVGCAAPKEENSSHAEIITATDETTPSPESIGSVEEAESGPIQSAVSESSVKVTETMLINEDMAPSFPGGISVFLQYLGEHLEYPQSAIDDKVSGTVIVSFVVTPDGSVKDVHVIDSVRKDLDDAAIAVIKKSPKWKPAPSGKDSEPVNIPIKFRLPKQ